jgi:hypothetical protein
MVRIGLLVALVSALFIAPSASSADQKRIASYCSPSGDVCYGIFSPKRNSFTFQLTTAARYFTRYKICIKPPTGMATCKSFPVRRRGQAFGGIVVWSRNFPNLGPGSYRVTWKQSGQRLGPPLKFRVLPAPV